MSKKMLALNNTMEQIYQTDIYRIVPPKTCASLPSQAHETFFYNNSMTDHKISLNKFKKTKIISSVFSIHNETRNQLQE